MLRAHLWLIFGSHVFLGLLNGHLAATSVLIAPDCEYVPVTSPVALGTCKKCRSALVVNLSDHNMILFSGVAHAIIHMTNLPKKVGTENIDIVD
jgi:hypothetical protein